MMGYQSCIHCRGRCIRNGHVYGKQRYRCKACGRSFVERYTYRACDHGTGALIPKLVREGCGIRSIGRALNISKDTVLRRILRIARRLAPPARRYGMEYEIDEMQAPCGRDHSHDSLSSIVSNKRQWFKIWLHHRLRDDEASIPENPYGHSAQRSVLFA